MPPKNIVGAIETLIIDCAHDIDDDNLEAWPNYFTENAIYQIISRRSFEQGLPLGVLYCEGKGMMIDRIQALRTANIFEPHTHCHLLSRPSVKEAESVYTARTKSLLCVQCRTEVWRRMLLGSILIKFLLKEESHYSGIGALSWNRTGWISCW